ncbi:MAG: thiol reductant ABC exporter subunit CydC [Actinomycetes bacterium]
MVSPVRAVWRDMSTHRRELLGAAVLGAIASLSAVGLLGTSAWLISRASEMPPVLDLSIAALLVRVLAISRALFRYGERLVGHDAAFRGLTQLRVVVYTNLERLAPTGLAAFGRGDLLTRLVGDVDAALDLPLRVMLPWMQAILTALVTVAFVTWLLPPAGIVVGLLAVVSLTFTPWIAARTARVAEERVAPAKARMSAAVVQQLDATADITVYGAGRSANKEVRRLDDDLTRLNEQEAYSLGMGTGFGVLVQGLAVTIALAVGIGAVWSGRIEPVWLAVVALLPLALFDVLSTLPGAALAYQRLRGSAERIVEVERAPIPVPDPVSPVAVPADFGGLAVQGLTSGWGATDADDLEIHAIRDVTLSVAPGERVAVIGPSGAGKSTLANVLMGFLPYQGSVRLSGVEIREANGDDVRGVVGMLTQQAHIFDTSVADNIRIGDPSADDATINDAIEQVHLSSFVAGLPDGIDTVVGSFGASISGGERQRIALARLLLAGRTFVILDEPTEHLDGPTAQSLTETIMEALRDDTLLLITHRLTGLEGFDRIIELQDGRVVAEGTHERLLADGGWYADQWRTESELHDMADLIPRLPVGVAVPPPGR